MARRGGDRGAKKKASPPPKKTGTKRKKSKSPSPSAAPPPQKKHNDGTSTSATASSSLDTTAPKPNDGTSTPIIASNTTAPETRKSGRPGKGDLVCGAAKPDGSACEISFSRNNTLLTHQRDKHGFKPGEEPARRTSTGDLVCDLVNPDGSTCLKRFTRSNHLLEHQRGQHGFKRGEEPARRTGKGNFVCNLVNPDGSTCLKRFAESRYLLEHQRGQHGFKRGEEPARRLFTGTGNFVCNLVNPDGSTCLKRYRHRKALYKHRQLNHRSQRSALIMRADVLYRLRMKARRLPSAKITAKAAAPEPASDPTEMWMLDPSTITDDPALQEEIRQQQAVTLKQLGVQAKLSREKGAELDASLLEWLSSDTDDSNAFLAENPEVAKAVKAFSGKAVPLSEKALEESRRQRGRNQERSLLSPDAILTGLHGSPQTEFTVAGNVIGDGNCLCRALSVLLFGSEGLHQMVRGVARAFYGRATGSHGFRMDDRLATDRGALYLQLNQQTVNEGHEDTLDDQFFRSGNGANVWITDEGLQVLADALDVTIFIHTPSFQVGATQPTWELAIRGYVTHNRPQLHILHLPNSQHFMPLRPRNSAFRYAQVDFPNWRQMIDPTHDAGITTFPHLPRTLYQHPLRVDVRDDARTDRQAGRLKKARARAYEDEIEQMEARAERIIFKKKYPIPRIAYRAPFPASGVKTKSRKQLVTYEQFGQMKLTDMRPTTERAPFVQFGQGHIIDLSDSGPLETPSQRLERHGYYQHVIQISVPGNDAEVMDELARQMPRVVFTHAPHGAPAHGPLSRHVTIGPNEDGMWSDEEVGGDINDHAQDDYDSSSDSSGNNSTEASESDLSSVHTEESDPPLSWSASPPRDVFPRPAGYDGPAYIQPQDPPAHMQAAGLLQNQPQSPVWTIMRFSGEQDPVTVAQALASHDAVMDDWVNQMAIDHQVDQNVPDVPYPQNARRFCVNGRSATESLPHKDSPYVPPELLQLVTSMEQVTAMGQNAPIVYFIIRSISGLSVARTLKRFFGYFLRRNPHLRFRLVFAFRQAFMDALDERVPNHQISFLNNKQPTALGMWYTHPINVTDLITAEDGLVPQDPAATSIIQLFVQEMDGRTGGMDWDDACRVIFGAGADRNGSA